MVKDVKPNINGNMKWEERHTHALTLGIIQHLLTSRPAFYHLPGLHGEVDGHGGNRVSQKIIETCKKIARDAGLDAGVVQTIIEQGEAKASNGAMRQRDLEERLQRGRAKKTKQEI